MEWATVMPLITAGVSTAGQIAASRQAGRAAQAGAQVPVDQLNQRAYETDLSAKKEGLDANEAALIARAVGMLQEGQAGRDAPGQRASNAVRGDILANAQDATFSGSSRIPKFSFGGGLRPSMFSDSTRKLGGEMSRQALLDQLDGEDTPFSDLPKADFSSITNAPGAPRGTALPQASGTEAAMNAILQYAGPGLAALQAAQAPRAAAPGSPVAPNANNLSAVPWGNVASPAPPPVQQPMLAGRVIGNGTTIPRY
jgi:hypothetical protein